MVKCCDPFSIDDNYFGTLLPMIKTPWNTPDRPLILASQSPRRKSLLAAMGFTFLTVPPALENEESYINVNDLHGSLQQLAYAKAQTVADKEPGSLVLGADTIVVSNRTVLGKPIDRTDAGGMISQLSGNTHQVYTGIALICRDTGFMAAETVVTDVRFRPVTAEEIAAYLDKAEWADKAGAYGIQDEAMIFVDTIFGCFYNVMGLPVGATIRLFERYKKSKGPV
jgi:septum formation protein